MKTLTVILCSILLVGCATTAPVVERPKFPEPPSVLMQSPNSLSFITTQTAENGEVKLSNVLNVIIENYQQYAETALQLQSLQDWIKQQQELWNNNKEQ
jgi:uncharacterized protein YcfL